MPCTGRNLIRATAVAALALVAAIGPAAAIANDRPHRPPEVWTGQALEVHGTYVVLRGTVDPRHQVTTYWYELGETDSYGIRPELSIEQWLFNRRESAYEAIPQLHPHTTYHFRLVARNRSGTTYGKDKTFTTLGRNA